MYLKSTDLIITTEFYTLLQIDVLQLYDYMPGA